MQLNNKQTHLYIPMLHIHIHNATNRREGKLWIKARVYHIKTDSVSSPASKYIFDNIFKRA